MDTTSLFNNAIKAVKANAPEILTSLGVSGVVTTAVLTAKATIKAEKLIDQESPMNNRAFHSMSTKKEMIQERVKLTWKCYIPPVVSGAVTIGCILASHKSSSNRTTAAVAAYSLTERAFSEYKEKAVEAIGAGKEQKLRDDIAQERVNAQPLGREVVVVGKGNVLCCDLRSMKYFYSSHEAIRQAENEINFQVNHERYVPLSEFYVLVGLPITKESVYNGWQLDRGLMELDFSTTLADNNEPCLCFDFNYVMPLHDAPRPDDPICDW